MKRHDHIGIRGAAENNLRSVSLEIPKNKLVVVTGISGSGKSSLVFDVLFREAERRYLATFTTYARQFLQRTRKPGVEEVTGLSPAIAIDQHAITRNPRSTVGTLTEIYDYLRLLYARVGVRDSGSRIPHEPDNLPASGIRHPAPDINRSLFSFNSPEGACPVCRGLGVEDRLDPELMVRDSNLTLREGALVITAPNGYIIYSQVTLEVLNQVCEAEGFTIDVPWKDLTPDQKRVILYGSDSIQIPYGKHPLESRMRWSGITAKPREMGFYKGIIPVMETILKRERNRNILRFVRTTRCSACDGGRLNPAALAVTVHSHTIAGLAALQMDELKQVLEEMPFMGWEKEIASPILDHVLKRISILLDLGLDYLALERDSPSLSAGEAQRIRLGVQVGMGLQGLLYILDEPSVGLHPADSMRVIRALKALRDKGNSVIVVEHEEAFIRHADWLIDLGPGAGADGGEVLVNGPVEELDQLPPEAIKRSQTLQYLFGHRPKDGGQWRMDEDRCKPGRHPTDHKRHSSRNIQPAPCNLSFSGVTLRNLRDMHVTVRLQALNVVTGVSGAGKSSLVLDVIGNRMPGSFRERRGWETIGKVISVDQSPIGKSSRSNPATYTGLFDHIRELFASLPESKSKGYTRSRFSFNTPGGRCESCEGAGYHQVGMHFLGMVEVLCETCLGRQFNNETLEIRYKGKSIADVLELSVSTAIGFFNDREILLRHLQVLESLGLGYLHLGQRSSTLSGGEAQRVKLATELVRSPSIHALYLLDEPTTGLHQADVERLLNALQSIVRQHHTVIVIEHHPALILAADHVVDLGPGSGRNGGKVVASGTPHEIMESADSLTGRALQEYLGIRDSEAGTGKQAAKSENQQSKIVNRSPEISLSGVTTNNLKTLSCRIPHGKITVITGVSGSGKSSLAFDTLFAEGRNRFLESFSSYARSQMGIREKPSVEEVSGLTPTFAVDQRDPVTSPRSTVGTYTGIYDMLRLLYSRYGQTPESPEGEIIRHPVVSTLFSFNDHLGACPACDGLGNVLTCSPGKLITHPGRALPGGAMNGTRTGRFYGDPSGQYMAILKAVGWLREVDYSVPWSELTPHAQQLALEGTGEEIYDVTWKFRRKERTGEHHFRGKWTGLLNLVDMEYKRKHADHRGEEMKGLMEELCCPSCNGKRLKPEALSYRILDRDIADLSSLSVRKLRVMIRDIPESLTETLRDAVKTVTTEIEKKLEMLDDLGLGYLSPDRTVDSLSGGEFQRVKLSGQIGSGLVGITYVLDEPTAGLHPVDTARLWNRIVRLREAGNTLVLVEHDPDVIRRADLVIDMGPGAGQDGGEIIATGTPEELQANPRSVTGIFLNRKGLPVTSPHRFAANGTRDTSIKPLDIGSGTPHHRHSKWSGPAASGIGISDATLHNLNHLSVVIPTGGIVAVTGVSGSGKSTLVNEVLYGSWLSGRPAGCRSIDGLRQFHRMVSVRQKRHFSDQRGTPVTYTGIFDPIRELFAGSTEAKAMGLTRSHFSFLSKQGACQACNGSGDIRISMDFLADVRIPCERCHGLRYREEVQAVRIRDKGIGDILQMTFREAERFFSGNTAITGKTKFLSQIGLDYLILGQPLETLSGGEAQRLTLAKELIHPIRGAALYVFDEPSSGLHPADIPALLTLLDLLVEQGHSVIAIEHHPEVIMHADWIIDLGPGGGDQGGCLVASGPPEMIMQEPGSHTGAYLLANRC